MKLEGLEKAPLSIDGLLIAGIPTYKKLLIDVLSQSNSGLKNEELLDYLEIMRAINTDKEISKDQVEMCKKLSSNSIIRTDFLKALALEYFNKLSS